ncbi:MAG: aspartate-semialdehyde dehydrogenase [Gammaproteobacteria bacterium]|nr:aspartate-semialdehyde dehydrogenase [Gammaproteobacteria bacterium]NNC96945.1 aspartate-semialdehyde dehydrogenase [Gammaproteobacteria bacterium]NNM13360.1 aspartate-semialdehyde dehydrogenase [Gammaproteobacteria bacterium]
MSNKYNLAILGATGLVGETIMEILQQRDFPVNDLSLLASERSAGKRLSFGKKNITVQNVEEFDFSNTDIALFSAGGSVSEKHAPRASQAGCVVIDNTSAFRYQDDIPLVVSEVNPEKVADYKTHNIIANPNCTTMQMMPVLKPLSDAVGLERMNVASYQAVSGAGKSAMQKLSHEVAQIMNARGGEGDLSRQLAFNAVPAIDVLLDNGYTKEEMKIVWESRKILGLPKLRVNATAVRVPVFFGHSMAVNIETREKISADKAMKLLEKAPGVRVVDNRDPFEFPTAVSHATNRDEVFVGRIREDVSHELGLNLWVVGDNIRKGAALNAVQIAEILVKSHL